MLEGLVAWVLNNYLGKYVENLNTDQLSVALPSGKVELENLPLKKDALRHLGLPVEVKSGFIGKVKLHVPVRQIRSAPWLIAIEKLYLVAAPVNLDEWDADVEANILQERKMAALDALEAQWRAELEACDASYYATSYSSWLSYGTGLLANIVQNLQLKVNDVHIRYEDALTCDAAFACGLTAESLTAESCDSAWQRGFTLFSDHECSFKLLELQQLAVYWDPVPLPSGLFANCTITELTERMSQTWKADHKYLVAPSSAVARVKRERTEQPLRSRTRPRIKCNLTLDTVLLNLTSRQYSEAVKCARGLERIGRVREFRARRPSAAVCAAPRAWWRYAVKCHLPHHHWMEPRPTWEECLEAARLTREYVAICLFTLSQPAATLSPERRAAKERFEWRQPLHVLQPLREVAMRKVPKSSPAATPDKPSSGRSMLVHWFPQWWGWYGNSQQEPAQPHTQPHTQLHAPPDLEEEILDVIADSLENNTLLKRDTVFGQFEFLLNKGSLNLCMVNDDNEASERCEGSGSGRSRLELQFSAVSVSVESRPRAAAHALSASVGAVSLRDPAPRSLYPLLVAHGQIREGLSAINVTSSTMSWCRAAASPPPPGAPAPSGAAAPAPSEPLFQLAYEKKPIGLNCDYKLYVKCQSVEVVYNTQCARWLQRFLGAPWGDATPPLPLPLPLPTSRHHLLTHWQKMMHGDLGERRSWNVELDISAPQIFFVEELCSREAPVLVVDFGRMRLANVAPAGPSCPEPPGTPPTDDEERFMTPCSTPPGSLLSPASPPEPAARSDSHAVDAQNLHLRLYDRYNIEFSDLQVLVGRARDNWKYAHTKSTSSLHLLDRFSISLQAERRVVHTSDPQFPTATLCGTLPSLVVHLSEQKLASVTSIVANSPLFGHSRSPQEKSAEKVEASEDDRSECSESERTENSLHNNSRLFMLQFAIDQMSLEVQSRGRSVAEVQVCGVRTTTTARPRDLSLALSVHSLLLVDALQVCGPDFELLVASHKHVGMDVASGSILGSEPTSPTSPASPSPAPPGPAPPATPAPPPLALHQAVSDLHASNYYKSSSYEAERAKSPSWTSNTTGWGPAGAGWGTGNNNGWGQSGSGWGQTGSGWGSAGMVDSEALIAVELCFVKGEADSEDLRIANILFNNLDIIANQETIVELIGFAQRVCGRASHKHSPAPPPADTAAPEGPAAPASPASPEAPEAPAAAAKLNSADSTDGTPNASKPSTESTDVAAKEIRTEITFEFHRLGVLLLRAAVEDGNVVAKKIATATLSEAKIRATVESSGMEVEGSLGGAGVVSLCSGGPHARSLSAGRSPPRAAPRLLRAPAPAPGAALRFTLTSRRAAQVCVSVRVASVWYTHSPSLLRELRSCLSEFNQYLANLARSIRAAAADYAHGLRMEGLYANPKMSQSMEGVSPRRRTTSLGCSLDDPTSEPNFDRISLSMSVELETPVVVVPSAAHSPRVLVAHLGHLSLAAAARAPLACRLRDICLYSLDVSEKLKTYQLTAENMPLIYDAQAGKPVLHNTELQFNVNYNDEPGCEVSGKIVGRLRVTSTREQYAQAAETVRWLCACEDLQPSSGTVPGAACREPCPGSEMEPAVPTLRLDSAVRAAVLGGRAPPAVCRGDHSSPALHTNLKVNFQLPSFTVELRADFGEGEKSVVDLSFREFNLNYAKLHPHLTNIQMSLHSITMEDLTQEPDSKHRMLLVSHTPQVPKAVFVSKSCPDFVTEYPVDDLSSVSSLQQLKWNYPSLPSDLHLDKDTGHKKRDSCCGATPPCSPEVGAAGGGVAEGRSLSGEDNLVWISVQMRDPQHPLFEEEFDKVSKLTRVEFNCLKLVLSVDSWVAVLDFFGDEPAPPAAAAPAPGAPGLHPDAESISPSTEGHSKTEMSIRSLSVLLVGCRGEGELCRGQVSNLQLSSAWSRGARAVSGRLGALQVSDLSARAPRWRRVLYTAAAFHYRVNPPEETEAEHDSSLSIDMTAVTYVHSRRFVATLQQSVQDFSRLRAVIQQARQKVSTRAPLSSARRVLLKLRARAPVIALPVSGRRRAALVAELHTLSLNNCFITTTNDSHPGALLDVRTISLAGLSVWVGRGGVVGAGPGAGGAGVTAGGAETALGLRRRGPPLLPAPAHLTFTVEVNMSETHHVPDMTITGTLTTLQITLEPEQYRIIRGVLAHNLGEDLSDLTAHTAAATATVPQPASAQPSTSPSDSVWTMTSIKLDLHDVTVKLEPEAGVTSLACINFIKSRLLVETYSDQGQDIDLVSQEILVSDTRYGREPANCRGNVFSHIVQPQPDRRHLVQAEVHARKRGESAAYTILINNMRLMAILDWWEAAHQFIMQPPLDPDRLHSEVSLSTPAHTSVSLGEGGEGAGAGGQIELKLNITDSQLVLVEDASVWDTNAVILKSTTVITYRGANSSKPVSCVLNSLEVFSCVLGLEEETALSIVDPCTVHVDLRDHNTLHIATRALSLRLSYHDMRMFAAMLRSLPVQARQALSGKSPISPIAVSDAPANSVHMRAGGALALALQQRRPPYARATLPPVASDTGSLTLKAVEVQADCITLCVIDDCLDSDVPLLEVSLSDLQLDQDLRKVEDAFSDPLLVSTPAGAPPPPGPGGAGRRGRPAGGRLAAVATVDYYNRTLSGWEPVIEPWRFETSWEYTLSSSLSLARLQVEVTSPEVLNTNVTSSLIELVQLVRTNWTYDYYAGQSSHGSETSPKGSPAGHRRRSPFVPYALRNHTGHRLWFTTLLTTCDVLTEQSTYSGPDDSWVCVRADETEPFSFGPRGRERGGAGGAGSAGGAARLHQLALRLEGWSPPAPVCVDRAGVFWRSLTHTKTGTTARIVLEVSLEGSARKLVTVRSALVLRNLLPHPVELRVDHAPLTGIAPSVALRTYFYELHRAGTPALPSHPVPIMAKCAQWSGSSGTSRTAQVAAGAHWAVPLRGGSAPLWVRPLCRAPLSVATRPLDWREPSPARKHFQCTAPDRNVYRFCCVCVRERFPLEREGERMAGHTLTLVPELRLQSLLPAELQYRATAADDASALPLFGAVPPGATVPFHEVNVEEGVELSIKLEGFGWSSPLAVGGGGAAGGGGSFSARLKLRDLRGRRLYLTARVSVKKTDGIKVSISAAYWIVNKVGLPLVFRAEGGSEAAGQFEEHEVARARAPLLFAFAEADGGPTISARLGMSINGTPEWCSPFGLGPGIAVKKLEVRGGGGGGGSGGGGGAGEERVYCVGVNVRVGRGRYRHTNIVTLTPRYQLHNNTSYLLQVAQKCTATDLNDPYAMSTHVTAPPGCYLPWHWPRWERPQLLCVRVLHDAVVGAGGARGERGERGARPRTAWSGAAAVGNTRSLHLACREQGGGGGGYVFLRVEVVSQGASLFVVVGECETVPPPLRLDNYSPVAIMFHQVGCGEECVVGAHASVPWALPEPEGGAALCLRAPGGPRLTLPTDGGESTIQRRLDYHNFIYVAFVGNKLSASSPPSMKEKAGAADDNVLVLEVPIGSTKVLLGKKRYGDRCQLWRRGPNEQLIHEGSSPPQPTDHLHTDEVAAHAMVLDIEGPAPRPGSPVRLALRRPDPRRASTQAWRLVRRRMRCAHDTLAVSAPQPLPGACAVLSLVKAEQASGAVPADQRVEWQTLRPGSGHLNVTVYADGPTRVINIVDQKAPEAGWIEGRPEAERGGAGGGGGGGSGGAVSRECGVRVRVAGVGVSLVARAPPEELLYARLAGLQLDLALNAADAHLDLQLQDMQWDNQLLGTPSPVLLYCPPERGASGGGAGGAGEPALHAAADLALSPAKRYNAYFFRHFIVSLRPIAIRLEERLILKLCLWGALEEEGGAGGGAVEEADETEYETHRVLDEVTAVHATRYYFGVIKIIPSQIRLSMCTANKLEGELAALKRRLGLTLIRFEDAAVELEPFVSWHPFDTAGYLARLLLNHFKDELKWQAAKILGSVDFLGNPLGFVADVSEGVSGLIYEGSVGALFKNVTHGLSNSAAKLTESLGDGLERVIVDEAHEETRRRIRRAGEQAHLAAGFRGLGLGLLGGMTSLVKHSYEGAVAEGVGGFLAGVGKGLVGTLTKPAIGVLDLAAHSAAALRDTSRRPDKWVPGRVRPPRCAAGPGGLLPRYCGAQARGAHLLYQLNGADYSEVFLAYRIVRDTPHDIRAVMSTDYLRIFTCKNGDPHVVMETHLSNLVSCAAVTSEGAHYVELGVRGGGAGGAGSAGGPGGAGGDAVRRPRVQCDSAELAAWVARHAAYARQLYHESVHTLLPHTDL